MADLKARLIDTTASMGEVIQLERITAGCIAMRAQRVRIEEKIEETELKLEEQTKEVDKIQNLLRLIEEQLQEALLVMPVLTRCFSRNVSELQLWEDGVFMRSRHRDAVFMIVREPPRRASAPRDRGTPRNASKSTKRPPTTSSDGDDS